MAFPMRMRANVEGDAVVVRVLMTHPEETGLLKDKAGQIIPAHFIQSVTFSLGGGAGFTLALVLMASVRERLQLSNVPDLAQGTALSLMLAGILSLAFMGFAGLGG